MRVVLQRVLRAKVSVAGQVVGEITESGLVALVGVTHSDTVEQAQKLAQKTHKLRILHGEQAAGEIGAPVLAVSQFTLYADTRKGKRPSWSHAAPSQMAEPIFDAYVQALKDLGLPVQTGVFGADMQVELVNDGPVTLILEADKPQSLG